MNADAVATRPWLRGALGCLLVLVLLAPVFAWASGVVGYAEPLENAAHATGAADAASSAVSGLLPGYTVPGLNGPLGTLASAALGTLLTLAVALGTGRLLER
ncbi:PDGLE domain-containing protein [Halarchaeum salinum]|uniref:PDGLE domain-containing protein n=1 Tax=Halarchaeum salinum TaxID=489912 RepID=A0AAV3SAL4_9EURY